MCSSHRLARKLLHWSTGRFVDTCSHSNPGRRASHTCYLANRGRMCKPLCGHHISLHFDKCSRGSSGGPICEAGKLSRGTSQENTSGSNQCWDGVVGCLEKGNVSNFLLFHVVLGWPIPSGRGHKYNFRQISPSVNPFTPESDQSQISPPASPEMLHHTVKRTWLIIAYSDERWL